MVLFIALFCFVSSDSGLEIKPCVHEVPARPSLENTSAYFILFFPAHFRCTMVLEGELEKKGQKGPVKV